MQEDNLTKITIDLSKAFATNTASICSRCGKPLMHHQGIERFCPFISTYLATPPVVSPPRDEQIELCDCGHSREEHEHWGCKHLTSPRRLCVCERFTPTREAEGVALVENLCEAARLATAFCEHRDRDLGDCCTYSRDVEKARDAARWRALRPMLSVDGDIDDSEGGGHFQWLIVDDDALQRSSGKRGYTHTVESLADALAAAGTKTKPR